MTARTLASAAALFALALFSQASSAELAATQDAGRLTLSGGHFRLTIDTAKGGEITAVELFDGSQWNRVVGGDGQTCPRVAIRDGSREYLLAADAEAKLESVETGPEVTRWRTTGRPRAADGSPAPWTVSLACEAYAEGALFVDLEYHLEKESTLAGASVALPIDPSILGAAKYRQETFRYKIPALPSARAAFGINPLRSYTNEIQAILEYNRPMAGKTAFAEEKGRFTWTLADGQTGLQPSFRYQNRLSFGFGSGVCGKPRTNVIGQRVYHWINFLDLKQRPAWYPSNEQIDKMAGYGGTMLILHQHWMLEGGSNGNPHAVYQVARDDASLRRMVDHAHRKGMRVGLYRRGIERYSVDVPLFGKYLERNRDGFYVDWHGPHCVAIHEDRYQPNPAVNDSHYCENGSYLPAREYFLFTRRLREIVGPQGFLIGHQGVGNSGVLANLAFDGYLPGEAGSDHAMFSDMDSAVYRGMMGGGITMPWPLDSPAFSSPEGVAKMAAWGMYPHVGLGLQRRRDATLFTLDPDGEANRFALPYWRVLKSIDVNRATVYNLPSVNRIAAAFANPDFQGLVYREDREGDDAYLLVVANLGKTPARTTVTLATDVLGMSGEYQVRRIDSQTGEAAARGASSGVVETSELPSWGIEGYRLDRP
ncbi:MAG: hypothetical protein HUU20_19535 [Pirellulales bacterium]|nr:hypothetical protein [Pirellulales bacterium]